MIPNKIQSIFKLGVRQKVMLVLLTVLLTALTVSGWMAIKKEKQDTLKEINQRGEDISRFAAKSLSYSVVGYDYHAMQFLLDDITVSDDIGYAKVESLKGNAMAESGVLGNEADNMVVIKRDITLEDQVVGKLILGLSTGHIINRVESQKYSLLKREALIILLIAFGEFLALSFIIIRPVSRISNSLNNNVDENGRITGMLPVTSRDEFGHLAESFNNLGKQLNEANDRLQSKIDLADQQLIETNKQLVLQSEELKHISNEFRLMSITDGLTGLYNRRHFDELIKSELKLSHRHGEDNSLIIIDIDFFKKINDNFGHPCGDEVLRRVAYALKERLRETDILCRLGGEEFVVLCRRANKFGVKRIAEHFRQYIEDLEILHEDQTIKITISIGMATDVPSDKEKDAEVLYKMADTAVYYSKENGRNCSTHYDDIFSEMG